MKPLPFSDEIERSFSLFRDAGGVVDFVLLSCDMTDGDVRSELTHLKAVITGMDYLQEGVDEHDSKMTENSTMVHGRIRVEKPAACSMKGRQISREEFLGPRYDLERNGLIVKGKGIFLNDFFFYSDPARHENILKKVDNGFGPGFAYAFSAPPYPLKMHAREKGELFAFILSHLLDGLTDEPIIYEWPTSWTNYFEGGDEWWGAFLWSIARPDSKQIVMIAASATD